jgi:hypothetical protein
MGAASVDLTASSPAIRIWVICAGSRRVGYPIRAQRSADETLEVITLIWGGT